MNTRPAIDESAGPVSLSAAFNQDSSCFSVGLDTGFCGKLASTVILVKLKDSPLNMCSLQLRAMRAQGFPRYDRPSTAR